MNHKPIFFTFPPENVPYPYILINANKWRQQIRYIRKYHKQIKIVIVDAGVEIFRDPKTFEYPEGPKGRIEKIWNIHQRIKRINPNIQVWPVIPDYPDDYIHRQLWLTMEITNIERTIRNIKHATQKYPETQWVIPVQGHYKNPKSIINSLLKLEKLGITKKYRIFGIANLCTENNTEILTTTVRIARQILGKEKWIHVFGPKLKSLPKIKNYIDSFDSTAWTRPVSPLLGNYSAKNQFQRILFFSAWYLRYLEVVR